MELTHRLGLTKMAISAIIAEMAEDRLILEQEADESRMDKRNGSGRRPVLISLVSQRINALGLYLSRDGINGVWCDVTGRVFQTWKRPFGHPVTSADYQRQLGEMFANMLAATAGVPLAGVGLSCIGPLNLSEGMLLSPPNFYGIENIPLRKILQEQTDLPIFIDNDMNAATLAEQLYGAARGFQHVVYIGLCNGVGAGIITYGRLFQGSSGYGGEIGHMSVDVNGPRCKCGNNGCLELYASIPVLLEKAGVDHLDDLVTRAYRDPATCQAWLPDLTSVLGNALVSLANIFDPEVILIGHQGVRLAPFLLNDLEKQMNARIFQRQSKQIPIRVATFGEQTPLIGAATLVFQAVFRGDLTISR
jgi:predicted NBD/HSP70 family sugar kinase